MNAVAEAVRGLVRERGELRAALQDVVDTSPGEWEHYDGCCTPENECCIGHVARVLRETDRCDFTIVLGRCMEKAHHRGDHSFEDRK